MADKTQLTAEEIYKVAYLHFVMGVEMHALSRRISEACTALEYAAAHLKDIYKLARTNGEEE